ncbi:UDP-N-acetylmuramoylalanyl-D-glutamate--2,6- diaminopimelate ligase [Pediococcus damnosus]|uniref:UDP-N-acetylmuramoyl-L-alanyl-D-glutamate--2,6-diaminopimelate ligase n=1 Tax=Pediococcus damnosus TaxID=51663 RepID=A0AAC9B1T3_9LACO|nr:UDP-N-acetylmuramoyl-L-alanyl-D-glutamate--2,6-diaminopimelate ligase [Pediococcus damnosus]AMV60150.1 UDP-N-acetylmuramoylalanyl-D-glutamate--2,6- diaminopimelate ligase [Pediococcus damnosus]AMV62672.1 UDP-N-acetylmuramoylalanyl-D-glutamate--2,6- diaminopimelate ligase [Pediococcus damnosus]AMV67445.1 UDP-N-acetylmuramoylalanyl-D-glutamate--2,6- diaminopimelate ligase [Pediococcus damnosus]KJU73758.1 UDP-N-acetylmuramoylalanyl-D-glutamate--2,6-diaminopimelate ligase [Pediococcus damnosus L
MKVTQLIDSLKFKQIYPAITTDFDVTMLTQDTREVQPGAMFIAVNGYHIDGHKLAAQAVEKGAIIVVAQERINVSVPVVYVQNTERAMAILADVFYQAPSQSMRMIGVTGTNGKTTVTHLIEQIYRDQNQATGLMGTMYRKIKDETLPTNNTTSDAITTQRTLAKMHQENVETVAMEVSSIALDLGRVWGIDFDIAVFTNLTRDHLDFHKTMANYIHAKSLLFAQLGNKYTASGTTKVAVLNTDDPVGREFEQYTAAHVLTYGLNPDAMIRAQNIQICSYGTEFDLAVFGEVTHVTMKLIGKFNVYNMLAAFAAAYASGLPSNQIIKSLEKVTGVKGRFQSIPSHTGVRVIVDYSHTPDSLLNALKTIHSFAKQDVYCVIGCGGDRDHGKRAQMAKIAVENSTKPIFTSDNPRTEDPENILCDMIAGVPETKVPVYIDRHEAIQQAIQDAKPGDVVLIAGKGHEDYQLIGCTKHHFDDSEEAAKDLALRPVIDQKLA